MTADLLPSLLLLATDAGHAAAQHTHAQAPAAATLSSPLHYVVGLGLVTISLGLLLCLLRIWRGPTLADRVLASDTFGLHVVGFVILLTIHLRDPIFFDAVLGVAIIGFASTVGFAQFIGAGGDHESPTQDSILKSQDSDTNPEASP